MVEKGGRVSLTLFLLVNTDIVEVEMGTIWPLFLTSVKEVYYPSCLAKSGIFNESGEHYEVI